MHTLYLLSVYVHILCATVWVGGIAFLVLVVVPWLRADGKAIAATFLRSTGERFRTVGWVTFAVLLVTGTFNLYARGMRFSNFFDPAWRASPFGELVLIKLLLFAAIVGVSVIHDFVVGPRASRALLSAPGSAEAERLRRSASRLGRLNALLALAIVAVAVGLVRGMP